MRLSGGKYAQTARHWTRPQHFILAALIAINCGVFVSQLALEALYPGAVREYFGISHAGVHDAYAWQFLTAMFLHSGPWHLAANMILLYLLGRDLEALLGQRHFLYLYLSGAVAAELGHLFLMPNDSVLYAGAGGIAALICAYAVILPEMELTSGAFALLRVKAKHLGAVTLFAAFVLLAIDRAPLVMHSALLGGCFAGWLYAYLLGFSGPSLVQRYLRRRRERFRRYEAMTLEQLMTQEINPLLEKISIRGLHGLTNRERRALTRARDKMLRDSAA